MQPGQSPQETSVEHQDHHQHAKRHDQHFYDSFLLVFGALFVFTIAVYWIATTIADDEPGAYNRGGAVQEQLIDQRLAPIGDVQVAGSSTTQKSSQAPAPTGSSANAAALTGKHIWDGTCSACHASGLLGAPKIGDKAAWAPRLAEGLKTLESHALNGYKQMPARGGNTALTDAQVIKALEYMLSKSGGAGLVPK